MRLHATEGARNSWDALKAAVLEELKPVVKRAFTKDLGKISMALHSQSNAELEVSRAKFTQELSALRALTAAAREDHKTGLSTPPLLRTGFRVMQSGNDCTLDRREYVYSTLFTSVAESFKEFEQVRGQVDYIATVARRDILRAAAQLSQVTIAIFALEHVRLMPANCRQLLAHGFSEPIVLATDSKRILDSITKSSMLPEKVQMTRMLV
ncbi:hypothetical protein FVE85_4788 [Porphyridium purpureum]|uniref:Uncharacterized protein n=1 Tax=Porphyridium purpureum TaxID=35688 RepID=A0A5J4YQ62_PORPP|nr:hypothetical protein FVE85_4788 [Porphyridium purpureum]|eukprot:POR0984..scf236_6